MHLAYLHTFKHAILALSLYRCDDRDNIVVYLKDLHFVSLSDRLKVQYKIPLGYHLGLQKCSENDPTLMVCEGPTQYLIFYAFTGFITVISLSILKFELKKSRKRKTPSFSGTFAIGNIVVTLMALLRSNPPLLAVLYHDIDFNYSLRYYRLEANLQTLTLEKQMELFSGTPSHVMAASSGCIVLSNSKLWYFPHPSLTLLLDDGGSTLQQPISLNLRLNVATLELKSLRNTAGAQILSSTRIDDHRSLVVTDEGVTFMLYAHVAITMFNSRVKQLEVIDLGLSTIASDLVYLTNNVFYAGSQTSRSILFRVCPSAPHIDVLATLSNTSPILDMFIDKSAFGSTVYAARGGLSNGEIEVVAGPLFKSNVVSARTVEAGATSLELTISHVTLEYLEETRSYDLEHLREDIKSNSTKPTGNAWSIGDATLEWNSNKFILYRGRRDVLNVADLDSITDLCWIKTDHIIVYAVLWNGYMVECHFGSTVKVSRYVKLNSSGQSSIVCNETGHIAIINLSGDIFQILPDSDEVYTTKAQGNGPFRISKGETITVYDLHTTYILEKDSLGLLIPSKLSAFDKTIHFCLANKTLLIVLFTDGNLVTYSYEKTPSPSYHSKELVLRLRRLGPFMVTLSLKSKADYQNGHVIQSSSISIMENLEVVHTFNSDTQIADICVMDGKYTKTGDPCIVAVYANGAVDLLLKCFSVVGRRIAPMTDTSVEGMLPKSCTVSKVCCHKNEVFLVGDAFLLFKMTFNNLGKAIWRGESHIHTSTPFYGIDVAGGSMWAFADAARGVYVIAENYITLLKSDQTPSFVTAVAVLNESPTVIYADSAGNIGAVYVKSASSKTELFSANLGHQINVIKVVQEKPLVLLAGTVHGEIFKLHQTELDLHYLEPKLTQEWCSVSGKLSEIEVDVVRIDDKILEESAKSLEKRRQAKLALSVW